MIGWITFVICIGAYIFVIKKIRWGFMIWNVGNGILLTEAWLRKDYGQCALWLTYTVLNCVGFIKWRK